MMAISRPRVPPVILAVVASAFVAWAVVASGVSADLRPLALLGALGITAVQLLVLRRASGVQLPFPMIIIAAFNLVGAAGVLYYRDLNSVALVSAVLPVGAQEYQAAALAFACASFATFVGALLAATIGRRPEGGRGVDIDGLVAVTNRLPVVLLVLMTVGPLLLAVLATGPAELLSRPVRLGAPSSLASAANTLAPLGMAIASFLVFGRRRPGLRVFSGAMLAAYFVVLFGVGTRALALIPLAMLASYLIQDPHRRQIRRIVPLAVVTVLGSLALLQLTLSFRGYISGDGLVPYTRALLSNPGVLVHNGSGAVIGNILYSVPLTGFVAHDVPALASSELFASITPLPSQLTSWPQLESILRVDIHTPYSALGELANQGLLVLGLYFAAVGYAVGRLQLLTPRLHGIRAGIMQLTLGGLVILFSLSALQYNLRQTTRFIWYALLIYAVVRLLPVISKRRAATNPDDTSGVRGARSGSAPPIDAHRVTP